jgi:hypothetical protein
MLNLVKLIREQSVYKSKKEELLYISQSQELHQLLSMLKLELLYDAVLNPGKSSAFLDPSLPNTKRYAEVQQLKMAYCLLEHKDSADEGKALLEGIIDRKIQARDLVIYPFDTQYLPENESYRKLSNSLMLDSSLGLPADDISISPGNLNKI